jgi:hypothetical protein
LLKADLYYSIIESTGSERPRAVSRPDVWVGLTQLYGGFVDQRLLKVDDLLENSWKEARVDNKSTTWTISLLTLPSGTLLGQPSGTARAVSHPRW